MNVVNTRMMKSVVFDMGEKYPKYQLGYDQYLT